MTELTEDKVILGFEQFCSIPDISHFITTRQGGCSEDTFASFNCAPFSGDAPERVKRNQEVLCAKLGINQQNLVIPFQTHGTTIRAIDAFYLSLSPEEQHRRLHGVDALISDLKGMCLCVSTADCAPVLLYDSVNKAVAVVHAGWRGTVAKIVKQTLDLMEQTYNTEAKDVMAAIGPSISADAFEVGNEVYEAFQKVGFDMERIASWNEESQKYHIDLWEANRLQLMEAGVESENIEISGICTYENHNRFFSARRLGTKSGRILSGIMLNK
ncbi:peptidoglycan editing factor PgeF [Bacteroides sedimenti]|uniref:Purine nucleoside phosphorylase n=1 Tax=Bacteroides sedimenti TaxID=2136147 RepID=A0ABN6Z7G2_9BACE